MVFHLYHDSMFATSIMLWIPATPAATKMDTVVEKENTSKKMRKIDLKAAETLIATTGNDKKKQKTEALIRERDKRVRCRWRKAKL